MQIQLDYGTNGLRVELPDGRAEIVDIKPVPALADAVGAIESALERPSGTRPLHEIARGKQAPCIVVSDVTRPVPNRVLLPPVLAALESAGVPRERITILFATGLHRPMSEQETAASVGEDVARAYRIVNHLGKDRSTNTLVGKTASGIPAWLDNTYLASDLRILVGLVEPHVMAGYSGGPKSVAIGLSTEDTIRFLHGPRIMEHPMTRAGQIKDNLLQKELHEIAAFAPASFVVNVTLSRDRRITGVFAGDAEAAHREAIDFIESYARVRTGRAFDVVLTTNAGSPLDINFYQCVKGMLTAARIVKKGGTIVMAARCPEGLGSDEFSKLMVSFPSTEQAMKTILDPTFFAIDQWAVEQVCQVREQAEILFYSEGISAETLRQCFVTPVASVEEGLRMALEKHGRGASIAVIPKGPYVIAEV